MRRGRRSLESISYCYKSKATWGGIGTGLSNRLQKLQNRAVGVIVGANWYVRSYQIISDLNWASLADRRTNGNSFVQNSERNE